MAFVVGVGLDRDALLGQFDRQGVQAGQTGLVDGLQLGAVLFDHPLVMFRGERRQTLGEQIVHGVAVLHLDHVALACRGVRRAEPAATRCRRAVPWEAA